jgi:hypothetical protein
MSENKVEEEVFLDMGFGMGSKSEEDEVSLNSASYAISSVAHSPYASVSSPSSSPSPLSSKPLPPVEPLILEVALELARVLRAEALVAKPAARIPLGLYSSLLLLLLLVLVCPLPTVTTAASCC